MNNDYLFPQLFEYEDADKGISGESAEMIEMKLRSSADINMYKARLRFERPAYYTKFMKGGEYGE